MIAVVKRKAAEFHVDSTKMNVKNPPYSNLSTETILLNTNLLRCAWKNRNWFNSLECHFKNANTCHRFLDFDRNLFFQKLEARRHDSPTEKKRKRKLKQNFLVTLSPNRLKQCQKVEFYSGNIEGIPLSFRAGPALLFGRQKQPALKI